MDHPRSLATLGDKSVPLGRLAAYSLRLTQRLDLQPWWTHNALGEAIENHKLFVFSHEPLS